MTQIEEEMHNKKKFAAFKHINGALSPKNGQTRIFTPMTQSTQPRNGTQEMLFRESKDFIIQSGFDRNII